MLSSITYHKNPQPLNVNTRVLLTKSRSDHIKEASRLAHKILKQKMSDDEKLESLRRSDRIQAEISRIETNEPYFEPERRESTDKVPVKRKKSREPTTAEPSNNGSNDQGSMIEHYRAVTRPFSRRSVRKGAEEIPIKPGYNLFGSKPTIKRPVTTYCLRHRGRSITASSAGTLALENA
mmetsp:Transcript_17083/g.25267  ORF Transcript_17083/g.25267 Transcript_17083/m.25267 type:complete len:179 (-) Transcript_17083:113-649(-)